MAHGYTVIFPLIPPQIDANSTWPPTSHGECDKQTCTPTSKHKNMVR